MSSIRTILIATLVALLTIFTVMNSEHVPVNLGFNYQFEVWLPLLMLIAFAIGFIPAWAWLSVDRARLRRRLSKLESALGKTESELAQAKVELLRPPATAVSHPAPPPGT